MTLLDLRQEVLRKLNDYSGKFWLPGDIVAYINEAHTDLLNYLPDTEKVKNLTFTFEYIANDGQTSYLLPANFFRQLAIFYNGELAEERTKEHYTKILTNAFFTGFLWYEISGHKLITPPLDLGTVILLEYIRQPTKLTVDEEASDFEDKYFNVLTTLATMRAIEKDRLDNPVYPQLKEKVIMDLAMLTGRKEGEQK